VRDVEVRFAVREGRRLAFEVFGGGPCDVIVNQTGFPIDLMWDLPQLAGFFDALGGFARVMICDSRGLGASDPVPDVGAATVEMIADDLLTVLDEVGSERATIFDMTYGPTSVVFAATYPQRVRSLIVTHLRTSFPEVRSFSDEQRRQFALGRLTTKSLDIDNPRVAHDPVVRHWWGRARRLLSNLDAVLEQVEFGARVDVTAALPAVRAPTLVLHRRGNRRFDIDVSRAAASCIPNARFVELPGSETDIFLGDTAPALTEIERFLHEEPTGGNDERPLATVLFTDIVASTEQLARAGDGAWRHTLDQHDRLADQIVGEYRGRLVRSTGDGILATFDGPARAVHCAAALLSAAAQYGIELRAGLHTGEIELRPPDIAGIAVHTASRIADLAGPNEILVSRTVVDLTAGSGLHFEPHGEHQLKGVPGTRPIFSIHPAAAAP
jgi:class 3 adenylate cyclase